MQFHFCLDLSDPLILLGTLFPYGVKPQNSVFSFSFRGFRTYSELNKNPLTPWWRRIDPESSHLLTNLLGRFFLYLKKKKLLEYSCFIMLCGSVSFFF